MVPPVRVARWLGIAQVLGTLAFGCAHRDAHELAAPKWSEAGPPGPNVVRNGPRRTYFPPARTDLARYAVNLRAMDEPSLLDDGHAADIVYRFVLVRSFNDPIAIRVERRMGKATLSAKRLGGHGGYNSPIEARIDRSLSDSEWSRAEAALSAVPLTREPVDMGFLRADGSDWLLERAREGSYAAVDRWSPRESDELRRACEVLLDLARRALLKGPLY